MRLLSLVLLSALLGAGCIAPSATEKPDDHAAPPPPADRIDGMTGTASQTDKVVDCQSSTGSFCAERTLLVKGRIGLDALPLDLIGRNGKIDVTTSDDDSWSFGAVLRVSAPTQDMANQGLDTTWGWTHVEGAKHALHAGPTTTALNNVTPLPITLPGATSGSAHLDSARYEVTLPALVKLPTARLATDNGAVKLVGFDVGNLEAETDNGAVTIDASVKDVKLATMNGRIDVDLTATATGKLAMSTDNGAIDVVLRSGALDVDGKTTNGLVTFEFPDGTLSANERTHKHFRSDAFGSAAIATTVVLETSNGMITARG